MRPAALLCGCSELHVCSSCCMSTPHVPCLNLMSSLLVLKYLTEISHRWPKGLLFGSSFVRRQGVACLHLTPFAITKLVIWSDPTTQRHSVSSLVAERDMVGGGSGGERSEGGGERLAWWPRPPPPSAPERERKRERERERERVPSCDTRRL